MQQNDINASNYQYYQPPHSHFQNPNPNPSFDHNLNPMPYTYASAPPIPYSDADFSSAYPPYPLNPQSYDPSSYIHNFDPNPSFSDNSYSAPYASNFGLSTPNYDEVLGGGGGVYAYDGGNSASAGSEDSGRLAFDDYGRPINMSGPEDRVGQGHSGKVIKAIPKTEMEEEEDVKSGVRKFRVQVLAENGGQSDMDVLCQVCDDQNGIPALFEFNFNLSKCLFISCVEILNYAFICGKCLCKKFIT